MGRADEGVKALDARFMFLEWKGDSIFIPGHDEGGEANQAVVTVG